MSQLIKMIILDDISPCAYFESHNRVERCNMMRGLDSRDPSVRIRELTKDKVDFVLENVDLSSDPPFRLLA
jgi:hypothetical protein